MPGSSDWSSLAASADADEIKEHILTGFKDGKPFTPYTPTVPLPAGIGTILDFGCGLGRNFPYLASLATTVVGYDLPAMIARCRSLATERVARLEDDWTALRGEPFDLVYASLVLQHVETDSCRTYLADFARMAPVFYLLTRTDSDFGFNVLDLVAECGAFSCRSCVEVEHDPATHQLRTIARVDFSDARSAPGSRHYEMLLRSR
ncbi:MAG TPA: class I SAM-dependent methyltransferase [Vicinamibacterales bacterium]